jgi:hypothetical protein
VRLKLEVEWHRCWMEKTKKGGEDMDWDLAWVGGVRYLEPSYSIGGLACQFYSGILYNIPGDLL